MSATDGTKNWGRLDTATVALSGESMLFSVRTVRRVSPSHVEHGSVYHVSDPAQIEYPLTGDFAQGVNDSIVESLAVGEEHRFIPQAARCDTHILDRCEELRSDLRTTTIVKRIS